MATYVFVSGPYGLRQMEDAQADYALIARWLTDERVLAFYEGRDNPHPLEKAREAFSVPEMSAEQITPCIIEYEGQPLGYLQFYPADPAEYAFEQPGLSYALDLFIGEPERWGSGLGTAIIRLLLAHIFANCGADWVLIDPHVDNPRAIRAYEKCGFRKQKILPGHEWHEGQRVDSWLMVVKKGEQE